MRPRPPGQRPAPCVARRQRRLPLLPPHLPPCRPRTACSPAPQSAPGGLEPAAGQGRAEGHERGAFKMCSDNMFSAHRTRLWRRLKRKENTLGLGQRSASQRGWEGGCQATRPAGRLPDAGRQAGRQAAGWKELKRAQGGASRGQSRPACTACTACATRGMHSARSARSAHLLPQRRRLPLRPRQALVPLAQAGLKVLPLDFQRRHSGLR